MNIDLVLRIMTLSLFIILVAYWIYSARKASTVKFDNKSKSVTLERMLIFLAGIFVFINILGFTLIRFDNLFLKIIGFILVLISFLEAMAGRIALGANWTQCYEYQIKRNHQLIQNGIYSYVRHPIYGGLLLSGTGALIVSGTYIFLPAFILAFFVLRVFAKREEKLLTKGFGKRYINYIKRTKMLIPFLY